jgi:HEPN domain
VYASSSVDRARFKKLAHTRLKDAEALLKLRRYSGAYYLAGYAVECALKACISKQTKLYSFPPKQDQVSKIYTHKLEPLAELARFPVERESKTDPKFALYWAVVKDWNEQTRYEVQRRVKAENLCTAVSDPRHGVLQCIARYW